MKVTSPLLIGLVAATCLLWARDSNARTVYLNGIDISSARNQSLKGINLRIDENGNLYIEAPHYQVNEEQTFTPLSSYLHQSGSRPAHQRKGKLPSSVADVGHAQKVPELPAGKDVIKSFEQPASSEPVENQPPKLQDKQGETSGDGE